MATAETVDLSEPHAPKEATIEAFTSISHQLKHELIKMRHDHDKHEPEYFRAVSSLTNEELTSFNFPEDLKLVRVGNTAYGLHLLGKIRIPPLDDGYIHVRVFVGAEESSEGGEEEKVAKLHSIHTEEVQRSDGDLAFRAIFTTADPLEWFET